MTSLIVRNYERLETSLAPHCHELKAEALERSALIAKVCDGSTQEQCAGALGEIKSLRSTIENYRQEAKAPLLETGRALDRAVKEFDADLVHEQTRLERLLSDFQAAELARQRSAAAAQVANLTALERDRELKLAQAPTLESREIIQAEFDQQIQATKAETPLPVPPKATGQRVVEDIDIEVFDVYALLRARPDLCKVEPLTGQIKEVIRMKIDVPGVRWKPVVKSTVTVARKEKVIDV